MDKTSEGGEIRYTRCGKSLYLILTRLPAGGTLTLSPFPIRSGSDAVLLGRGQPLQWMPSDNGIRLVLPDDLDGDAIPVVRVELEAVYKQLEQHKGNCLQRQKQTLGHHRLED